MKIHHKGEGLKQQDQGLKTWANSIFFEGLGHIITFTCKKLEEVDFDSGVLTEVFELLQIEVV